MKVDRDALALENSFLFHTHMCVIEGKARCLFARKFIMRRRRTTSKKLIYSKKILTSSRVCLYRTRISCISSLSAAALLLQQIEFKVLEYSAAKSLENSRTDFQFAQLRVPFRKKRRKMKKKKSKVHLYVPAVVVVASDRVFLRCFSFSSLYFFFFLSSKF